MSDFLHSFLFFSCSLKFKELQNKSFTNSFLISSLWLFLPADTQQVTEVFVEHNSFLLTLSSAVKVRCCFHNFLPFGTSECRVLIFSKTTTVYSILGRHWEPLGKLKVHNRDVCPFRWLSQKQYNLFFLRSIGTYIKRM